MNKGVLWLLVLLVSVSAASSLNKFDYVDFLEDRYISECSPISKCRMCINVTATGSVICAEGSVNMGERVDIIPTLKCAGEVCRVDFSVTDIATQTKDNSQSVTNLKTVTETTTQRQVLDKYVDDARIIPTYNNLTGKIEDKEIIVKVPTYKTATVKEFVELTQPAVLSPDTTLVYKEYAWWVGLGTVIYQLDLSGGFPSASLYKTADILSNATAIYSGGAHSQAVLSIANYSASSDLLLLMTVTAGTRTIYGFHENNYELDGSAAHADGAWYIQAGTDNYWVDGGDGSFDSLGPFSAVHRELLAFHCKGTGLGVEAYNKTYGSSNDYVLRTNNTHGCDNPVKIGGFYAADGNANFVIWNMTLINLSGVYVAPTLNNLSLTVKDSVTGISLSGFNATINGNVFNTSGATIYTNYSEAYGLVNITFQKYLYNDKTYLNYNTSVYGLQGNITPAYFVINVSAYMINGSKINAFDATAKNSTVTYSGAASDGSLIIYVGYNATYNVTVDAPGFELKSAFLNATTWTNYINFSLYTSNSITFYFYDETTYTPLLYNVSVRLTSTTSENTYYSATGSLYVDQLDPVSYSAYTNLVNTTLGYSAKSQIITIGNRTTQSLNIYLSQDNLLTTFTIKDGGSLELLSDVLITNYRLINSSWTALESKLTDISGRTQFSYIANVKYRFLLTKSGYDSDLFYLNPVLFDSYTFTMTPTDINYTVVDLDLISLIYSSGLYYNGESNNFSLLISSPLGSLTNYGYTISYPSGSVTSSGTNAIGGQLTSNFTIVGATMTDLVDVAYYYTTATSGTRRFNASFSIVISQEYTNYSMMENKRNTYGMGIFERLLIVTVILIFIVGIAALIGQAIPGFALGLLVFGYLIYIGFAPVWSGLVTFFLGIWIISARSGY